MKTRCGLVSNSSSSSFIVAAKPGQTKVRINVEVDLKDYTDFILKKTSDIEKSERVDENIENGWLDREKIINYIKEGFHIYEGSFSDEGDPEEVLLCALGLKATNFQGEILENEPGY